MNIPDMPYHFKSLSIINNLINFVHQIIIRCLIINGNIFYLICVIIIFNISSINVHEQGDGLFEQGDGLFVHKKVLK